MRCPIPLDSITGSFKTANKPAWLFLIPIFMQSSISAVDALQLAGTCSCSLPRSCLCCIARCSLLSSSQIRVPSFMCFASVSFSSAFSHFGSNYNQEKLRWMIVLQIGWKTASHCGHWGSSLVHVRWQSSWLDNYSENHDGGQNKTRQKYPRSKRPWRGVAFSI